MVLVVVVEEVMLGSSVAFHSFPKCIAIVVVWGVVGVDVVVEVMEDAGDNEIDDFDERTCC
jgi:hypothetical protein